MRRFLFIAVATAATAGVLVVGACSSSNANLDRTFGDDAGLHREGGFASPPDAGVYDAAPPVGPAPSCVEYCDLVMSACKDMHAQYGSNSECLEVCARLPPGDAGDQASDTVACRQFYAGSPARTDAVTYCLPAGPFGGNVCGDRCAVFCELAVGACSPTALSAPFASYPDCQSACSGFMYRDGLGDGGGEPPDGPTRGATLNCRLFHLRAAIHDGSGCADLGVDSGACRN